MPSKISHEVEQTPLSTFLNMNAGLQANNAVTSQKKLPISPQPIKLTSAPVGGYNILNMIEKSQRKSPTELVEQFQGLYKQEKELPPVTKPTLMPPAMFLTSNNNSSNDINGHPARFAPVKPDPLTQNQLMQAMNYLLETDVDFMRKLHDAYLKSYKNGSL